MIWQTRPRSDLGHGLTGHVSGQGPHMVLIHGVGLRLEAWNALCPLLEPYFTLFAVDMPGHGGSAAPSAASLDAFAAPFAATLSLTGPAIIVGHSMGAMIALDLATKHPDLATGVAALNAIYRRTPEAAAAVQARAAALTLGDTSDPAPTLRRWFGEGDAAEATACRDWLCTASPAGYTAAYTTFAHHDGPSDDDLSGLAFPSLFLTGEHDPNSTPAMSQAMAARTPQGRAVSLTGAAHMAPMTHPCDIATQLISTFGRKP